MSAAAKTGYGVEEVLDRAGTGTFQKRLLGIFGLVWAADAMQVIAVGFSAPSIAATFGLTLPQALQTGTLFFLGMLIGAYAFGRLADKYGRRRILLLTVAVDAIFSLASVFAPSFGILLALRFVTGLAVGGTLPVDYAMMAEFLPSRRRGRWLVMLEGFWAVGTVAVAVVAWAAHAYGVIDAWRVIFFATALPAIVGIGLRFWIPESPRYLLANGRAEEARSVFDKVLTTNGKPKLDAPVVPDPQPEGARSSIFSPEFRRRTIFILAIWLLVSTAYYGVFTWLPGRLAGEGLGFLRGYGFLILVALAQIPGYALAAYGVERWGRRETLIGFLLLSTLGCFLFAISLNPQIVTFAILLMSFALLGTWGALYAWTPELYPTAIRATGMGTAGAMARLGGLLAPTAIAPLIALGFPVAVGFFAALLFIAMLAAAAINFETRQRAIS
ncbi:MFS transporter [Aureimonas fodinaquatilis]|uniref:MFS transporter n=1 Tax=Aureimonas fodinaquatilis TaxID=2565783 RepID=A0A5B0E1H4_9HYPH|nr:MFS transporter [Aureimonas fodinaquatilis]KAA0972508.1 MFS transporter [Aureimonas fodinaquatilis]